MTSSVNAVFEAAGLEAFGPVRWGTPLPEAAPGVYAVSLASASNATGPTLAAAPLDPLALARLLDIRSGLRLDGAAYQPSVAELVERLEAFWLPDEVVLYLGLAGQPLRQRVRQYYRTPLGARRPHAGGWWLKTLTVLGDLFVYWAATPQYAQAEKDMLAAFSNGVSKTARAGLHDGERVMPFANLRGHDDLIKRHGITGATGELSKEPAPGG
jgi:hypothetical protein